jgi:hypothetical protein
VKVSLPCGRVLSFPDAPASLFDKCGDDDPALLFGWSDSAVTAVLPHLTAQVPRPLWFLAGNTTDHLKAAIVAHVSAISAGNMQSHAATIIAPLTLQESYEVSNKIAFLCIDPAMIAAYAAAQPLMAVPVGPLATILFVHDASRPARAVAANVAQVPSHGVQAFA